MMKYLMMILCVWMLVSCKESKEDAIHHLVQEWNGKEIMFPARSVFTVQGKDTVDFEHLHADYKIMSYVDSIGCVSCKLQLRRWKEFVEEVDSLTNGRVPFLFYFHHKDIHELRYLTRRDGFTYPVCFDEKDELNRLNGFPSDMTYQTFLLDKTNRVVAMGNPIYNPKVKKLYMKLITGNKVAQTSEVFTRVSLNQTVMDFGNFPQTEKQVGSFVLTNTGNNLLVIQDVTTSCGCTQVEFSKEPVRPGGTLELKVIYEAEKAERFNKTVTVYCNAEVAPFRLTVKGNAE